MKKTTFQKLINSLLLINIFYIIALLIFISFISENNKTNFIHTPLFILPWALFILLLMPYLVYKKPKSVFSIASFISFMFLIIFLFISLLSFRTIEITLNEKETIALSNIYQILGLNIESSRIIKLENFLIYENPNKKNATQTYLSTIKITNKKETYFENIQINRPLKIEKLNIYQKGFSLEVKNLKYEFNKKNYDFMKTKFINLDQNRFFYFYPANLTLDKKIIYTWYLLSKTHKTIEKGILQPDDTVMKKNLYEQFGFKILKENIILNNALQITYNPFRGYMAVISLVFLLALFLDFWARFFLTLFKGNEE